LKRTVPDRLSETHRRLLPDLAAGAALLAVHTSIWLAALGAPPAHAWASFLSYGALSVILLLTVPPGLPGPGAGWANRVTLFRTTLILPVAALLVTPGSIAGSTAWVAIAVATLALALDGVDGAVARRTGTATLFGARFDMELDAFLILALAGLVWVGTPLGPWVLWIGLIRYAFLLAGWLWAPLRAELPGSFRRKVVCVVQVAGLLIALAPLTPTGADRVVCATALALLAYSFGVDVRWLVRGASRSAAVPTR
jgi:phosphatidylglycerophosphate synthase